MFFLLIILSTVSTGMATANASATEDIGEGNCINFVRIEDGICAEACLGSFVGPCPRPIVVAAGFLEVGHCAAQDFVESKGVKHVIAGPCGGLDFNLYVEGSATPLSSTVEDCIDYRKTGNGQCVELCFPEHFQSDPRLFLASAGIWEQGLCEEEGYTLANGAFTKGSLHFKVYLPGAGRLRLAPFAKRRAMAHDSEQGMGWLYLAAFVALLCYRARKRLSLQRLHRSMVPPQVGKVVAPAPAADLAEPPSCLKTCESALA